MEECEVPRLSAEPIYARHPLSYMMEAADDICYLILDMEDAHKRDIISTEDTTKFFSDFSTLKRKWFLKEEMRYLT